MQKKSILFLTNTYPDFDSSYRGVFIKRMAFLLKKEGYEISVVTPKIFRDSYYFENQNGIKVYRFPFFASNKPLIEYNKIPYFRMILYYITGFFFTIYVLIKHHCQLIHVHWAIPTGLIGVLAEIIINKPLVVTIHGSDLRMAINSSDFIKKIFLYVCRKAKHLTCVSEVLRKEIERLGVTGENISTFPMSVDEAFLEVGKSRQKKRDDQPFKILSNRNLLTIYNVSTFIRAIPMILKEEKRVSILIAGDGPEKKILEEEAKNLGVNTHIQFLGRVPHEEMPKILSQADIYVSTSRHDGTSVSLLEAMASGVFPIVTDIASNREWINDGKNGFLFPISEEKIFAEKIIEAIHNHTLREESRKKNLSIVEQRALWSVNIESVKQIYTKLLNQ